MKKRAKNTKNLVMLAQHRIPKNKQHKVEGGEPKRGTVTMPEPINT